MTIARIAVIGAGVAGLSAAAAAARRGIEVHVHDPMPPGGQIASVDRIWNFPGFPESVAGYDIGPLMHQQAEDAGAFFSADEVLSVSLSGGGVSLKCGDGPRLFDAAIIAAGSSRRKLTVAGADRLEGHGVSQCASCDGPFCRNKTAVVIGGGDSAFDEAAILAEHAQKVLIAHRGEHPVAQPSSVRRATAHSNIEVLKHAEVLEVLGENGVDAIRLRVDGQERQIECAGVFPYLGLAANTDFLAGALETDSQHRLVVDATLRTSHQRVYAAGDIRACFPGTLAAAAGDGEVAAAGAAALLAS